MASRYDADVDFDNWLNANLESVSSPAAAAVSPAAAMASAEDKSKFEKDPWEEGDPWGGTGRPRPPKLVRRHQPHRQIHSRSRLKQQCHHHP